MVMLLILAVLVQSAPAAAAPLGPAADAALAAWRPKAAACKAPMATLPIAVAASLAKRVEVEQCLRGLLSDPALAALPAAERQAAFSRAWGEIAPVDDANTAWLKTVLPADGWFRASRDGDQAAHDAWLIVQHSPDRAWQAEVAKRMAPLARAGEVRGADYALLYDRVENFAGRPQYYGSQYRCEKGRWTMAAVRDPEGLDARRMALGMSSVAENAARINANGGC